MASISLKQVRKHFNGQDVLKGLSLEIADGEFVALVGPSGCGKSTLLRILAGLEELSGGEIRLGERSINQVPPRDRNIAMVFQNYALYPHMTVAQNLGFALRLQRQSDAAIAQRVQQVAEVLGLAPLLERLPAQLSGGQRQRVAMGRAIVREPQVFLFDEPLSNLDAKLRGQTRIEIQKLHAELGITSLFVTHDQVEAMTLAQRMIVMNAGNVEQFGTPEEVYHQPASTFVASFIGSPPMNLLHHAPGGQTGRILGVRPEHIDLVPGDGSGGWEFTVETVELLGAERLLYGKVGAEDVTVRVEEGRPYPKPGETTRIAARADRLHWFDQATGQRITA